MKVRHKASGAELEVAELLPQWWKTVGGSCIAYNDPAWELVKEEEWQDVTEHCDIGRYGSEPNALNGYIWITDESNHQVNVLAVKYYRLRKVDGLHHGSAFIIERRKP